MAKESKRKVQAQLRGDFEFLEKIKIANQERIKKEARKPKE